MSCFGSFGKKFGAKKIRPYSDARVKMKCCQCGKEILRYIIKNRSHNRYFCGRSCATKYTAGHRKVIKVSKLELFIQAALKKKYPLLNFIFNDKSALENTYELDIFMPDLKLAFEINGLGHYEAIYGKANFIRRQEIDKEKIVMCANKNILFFVLDIRDQVYVTPQTSEKYLQYICEKIDQKIKVENPTAVVK